MYVYVCVFVCVYFYNWIMVFVNTWALSSNLGFNVLERVLRTSSDTLLECLLETRKMQLNIKQNEAYRRVEVESRGKEVLDK